ncbi:MAG: helix-turn-helix domain-containing protein [Capsulimonas sp.]|uniref:winged helix-turn-helix transcriptional regulator n=1 Tax=Capsulimonas sp. TaxID=2494211 RepID=UPI00326476F6
MKTIIADEKLISLSSARRKAMASDTPMSDEEMCPMRDILDRVGDKWSVLVVVELRDGRLRFSDMRRRIDGISQRMLTHTLRQLERDGLVERFVYPSVPMRVEYELTVLGDTLIEPLTALALWSENNRGAIRTNRASYDARESSSAKAVFQTS